MSDLDDKACAFFKNAGKEGGLYDPSFATELVAGLGYFGGTVRPVSLQGIPVPPRKWSIVDWVPHHCVTGLYGDGGVGKSLLAMIMMTCVNQGYNFLGLPTTQAKTFGFFCEDTEEELHRRQNDINNSYGCEFIDLENMAWQSRVGCDNILMGFDKGIGKPTEAYHLMREEIRDIGAKFVVIDTAADTFGGNENARPEVRQYINLLGQLALEIDGTVILCAHPSRSGLADETGSGGSTAWNNTLRSRLYLRRPKLNKVEATEQESGGIRELEKMKSNYSSIGDVITLKWSNGVFHVTAKTADDMVSQIEKNKQDSEDECLFMDVLDQFNEQGFSMSVSVNSSNYAPKMICKNEKAKLRGIRKMQLAMERLINRRFIEVGEVGKRADRKAKLGLRRTLLSH